MDEVLAVGDAPFQQKCLQRIQAFLREGTAVILVSHSEAPIRHCHRVLVLEGGRTVALADAETALAEYDRRSFPSEGSLPDPGPQSLYTSEPSPASSGPLPRKEPTDAPGAPLAWDGTQS